MKFHVKTSILVIASLLVAAPAFAQWPSTPPPKTEPAPQASPPPKAEPAPHKKDTAPRGDDGSGFGFGVRAAYSTPSGGLTSSQDIRDVAGISVPLWVEAGYHFNKAIYAGLYFQWAPGLLSWAKCLDGQSCSQSTMRFGAEVIYGLAPDAVINPWVGLGVGYEFFNTSVNGADRTFKGFELVTPQVGVDWNAGKASVGLFASYSLFGKYTSYTASGVSNDIADTTGHSWLQVGIKISTRL